MNNDNDIIYLSNERNYFMSQYFMLKAKENKPKYRFCKDYEKNLGKWKQMLMAEIKKLLGQMPEPIAMNQEIIHSTEEDGILKQRVRLDLEKHMSATALVFIPKIALDNPAPAIICSHGHGQFGKDSVMGIRSSPRNEREAEIVEYNYDYGLQMAERGYVTMAIDWRGFGERREGNNPENGCEDCNINYLKGTLLNINPLSLNIFDGIRCIDYLCEQDYVNKDCIGAMGLSFGGTMTTWLAIIDERVKAADIICYSCMFETFAIKMLHFCGSQIFPGLYKLCDVPDLHGLIAPKPLLAEIGLYDECFLIEEALKCSHEVKKIYEAAGVPDNYEVDIFPGGHVFSGRKAFDFFDEHLKTSKFHS